MPHSLTVRKKCACVTVPRIFCDETDDGMKGKTSNHSALSHQEPRLPKPAASSNWSVPARDASDCPATAASLANTFLEHGHVSRIAEHLRLKR